jgi:glucokinase
MNARYIGIDIGGTGIKAGLCDTSGALLAVHEVATPPQRGVVDVLDAIAHAAKTAAGEAWDDVAGIGLGMAGFLDIPKGIVRFSANFPQWIDVPIGAQIAHRTNKPVLVNNDANVATLGEAWSGAGKGYDHVVLFTLGTGVGGGIIAHGRLVEGAHGMAGELGHIVVRHEHGALCGCGQYGCVETIASATGIVRLVREAIAQGAHTTLREVTAKAVFAATDDALCARVIAEVTDALAQAMAAIAVVVNPQRLIVGGGVSLAGDALLEPLREAFARKTPAAVREGVDIVPAMLGTTAGVIGAAGLHVHCRA